MNNPQQRRRGNQTQQRRTNNSRVASFDLTQISLGTGKLQANLFSSIAESAAKYAAEWDKQDERAGKQASKPTQLRKFYDEICMWQTKIQDDDGRLEKFLPFILMLKAKVAYSKGRKHVNDAYEKILNRCLDELEKNPAPQTLNNLKLFMEAFTGFYKVYGPK